MKNIAILGSTGSIGTQTLDVVRQHPERFSVFMISANNSAELLVQQAVAFNVPNVVICNPEKYAWVKAQLPGVNVQLGIDAACELVQAPQVDVVVAAMVGFSGLKPTLAAIRASKTLALANKETLVAAGELVMGEAKRFKAPIYPVDSEHSAIFQCLQGAMGNPIKLIHLTASGGPFRTWPREQIASARKEQALKHPNWDMGAKITIDSASMMNKGFEVIEARWLFDVAPEQIQVVVHPQSIIHSGVQFKDGAVKAQLGAPDMRVPIQLALSYPERLESNFPRLDWWQMKDLTFERPDEEKFRCLHMAYEAIRMGGNAACILNAANEVVNLAFRQERCGFLQMADVIEKTLQTVSHQEQSTLEDYLACDAESRQVAASLIK